MALIMVLVGWVGLLVSGVVSLFGRAALSVVLMAAWLTVMDYCWVLGLVIAVIFLLLNACLF